jgi:hypothetical protein
MQAEKPGYNGVTRYLNIFPVSSIFRVLSALFLSGHIPLPTTELNYFPCVPIRNTGTQTHQHQSSMLGLRF